MLLYPEETFQSTLCSLLSSIIDRERGKQPLPPKKKRGIGAEVLALIQELIRSPGGTAAATATAAVGDDSPFRKDNAIKSLQYSVPVCIRHAALISLSYSVIECMQRSSPKQFHSVCSWQCSFEER
jgi:hypothetical protein